MKYPVIPALHRARNSMGKGPFLADLGLLLWPKREQGDKSESDPLLHTLYRMGAFSDLEKNCFSQRVSESSQFLTVSQIMLMYTAIHVQIQVVNTAVQARIHIQGWIHLISAGTTEIIWAPESGVPTTTNGQEYLKHTTGPPSVS